MHKVSCFLSFAISSLLEDIDEKAKKNKLLFMEWLDDDDEAVEEFEELYSFTTSIDEEDLSDLEDDLLEDLDDEEEDIDF